MLGHVREGVQVGMFAVTFNVVESSWPKSPFNCKTMNLNEELWNHCKWVSIITTVDSRFYYHATGHGPCHGISINVLHPHKSVLLQLFPYSHKAPLNTFNTHGDSKKLSLPTWGLPKNTCEVHKKSQHASSFPKYQGINLICIWTRLNRCLTHNFSQ